MKEKGFRLVTANIVIAAVLVLALSAALVLTLPKEEESVWVNVIDSGNKQGESVSFMFNVYQNTDEVLEIAQIFKNYGMNATFFVGGSWVNNNADALIKLSADGFEIGNHGYLHRDHAKLSEEQNRAEIEITERLIAATLNHLYSDNGGYASSMLFAPPSGSYGKNMFAVCEKLNMKVIMWTRDTVDWRDKDADVIYSRAVKGLAAGDLVLMHPTPETVKALPRILDAVVNAGLKADTVSKVIAA